MSEERSKRPFYTPDGKYIVVRGRLWRATNPKLDEATRARHVSALMEARRGVKAAKSADNKDAEVDARRAVDAAKTRLGERGPIWWTDGTADLNRKMIVNTPYAAWFNGIDEKP